MLEYPTENQVFWQADMDASDESVYVLHTPDEQWEVYLIAEGQASLINYRTEFDETGKRTELVQEFFVDDFARFVQMINEAHEKAIGYYDGEDSWRI